MSGRYVRDGGRLGSARLGKRVAGAECGVCDTRRVEWRQRILEVHSIEMEGCKRKCGTVKLDVRGGRSKN